VPVSLADAVSSPPRIGAGNSGQLRGAATSSPAAAGG
jgi:hypothetical protein